MERRSIINFPPSEKNSLDGESGLNVSIAPIFSILDGKFENTANTLNQKETLHERTYLLGLRVYIDHFFVQGSYSWVNIDDQAVGRTNLSISANANGIGGALGLSFPITSSVQFEIATEVMNTNFVAKSGGFSSKAQYLKLGGFVGLSIAIPSGTSNRKGRSSSRR